MECLHYERAVDLGSYAEIYDRETNQHLKLCHKCYRRFSPLKGFEVKTYCNTGIFFRSKSEIAKQLAKVPF
jgi:hypothetical protein